MCIRTRSRSLRGRGQKIFCKAQNVIIIIFIIVCQTTTDDDDDDDNADNAEDEFFCIFFFYSFINTCILYIHIVQVVRTGIHIVVVERRTNEINN